MRLAVSCGSLASGQLPLPLLALVSGEAQPGPSSSPTANAPKVTQADPRQSQAATAQ